jgi:hypothetical protein
VGKNEKRPGLRPTSPVILKMVPVHPWSHIEDEHSCSLEILRGILAGTLVLNDLEADLLAFGEAVHASALDGRDVHENVGCAIIGLNESVTLGGIEELHGTSCHDDFLSIDKQKCPPDRFRPANGSDRFC